MRMSAALLVILALPAWSEVQELSNSEMTEAYIKDGGIYIKQRALQTQAQKAQSKKQKVDITISPGKAPISEAERVHELSQGQLSDSQLIASELERITTSNQLESQQITSPTSFVTIDPLQSAAAIAQEQHAQEIVRAGLGLSNDTEITTAHMTQYMTTFAGQNQTNNLVDQQATSTGLQFIMPNTGGYTPGNHSAAGAGINLEVTDQQIIWSFVYPQN